jgi:broad-specificity NMP kinase
MRKAILIGVTGTPASGKSTFARSLSSKTGIRAIEINSVARRSNAFSGTMKDGTKIVNLERLERALRAELRQGNAILVGHLAQELDLPYSMIVVVREDIGTLYRRMKARRYGREKINENLACEATDCCGYAAGQRCKAVIEVETAGERRAAAAAIASGKEGRLAAMKARKDKMREFAAFIREHKNLGL